MDKKKLGVLVVAAVVVAAIMLALPVFDPPCQAMLESTRYGGRGLVVMAPGCGPGDRGFESLRPPQAPVAQLDTASDFGSEGCEFESRRAYSHRY